MDWRNKVAALYSQVVEQSISYASIKEEAQKEKDSKRVGNVVKLLSTAGKKSVESCQQRLMELEQARNLEQVKNISGSDSTYIAKYFYLPKNIAASC